MGWIARSVRFISSQYEEMQRVKQLQEDDEKRRYKETANEIMRQRRERLSNTKLENITLWGRGSLPTEIMSTSDVVEARDYVRSRFAVFPMYADLHYVTGDNDHFDIGRVARKT
jgi:hypothetical protein